jgi:hypothetical protein
MVGMDWPLIVVVAPAGAALTQAILPAAAAADELGHALTFEARAEVVHHDIVARLHLREAGRHADRREGIAARAVETQDRHRCHAVLGRQVARARTRQQEFQVVAGVAHAHAVRQRQADVAGNAAQRQVGLVGQLGAVDGVAIAQDWGADEHGDDAGDDAEDGDRHDRLDQGEAARPARQCGPVRHRWLGA